jgi:hypothetical protein
LLLSLSYLWGAVANSFESLLWSNIIAAFAASSTEALGASIVNDLYFLHERANLMGVYMNFISGGNTIGPLICGFIASTVGWRWHKWLAFILTAINFLAVVFLCPETRYDRSHLDSLPPSMTASSSSIGKVSDEEEATPVQKTTSSNEQDLQELRTATQPLDRCAERHQLATTFPKAVSLHCLPSSGFLFLGLCVSHKSVPSIPHSTNTHCVQRLSRLGRCDQHHLSLLARSSALPLRCLHHWPDQHSRSSGKCLRCMGGRLARGPLLRSVQQASQRRLHA